MSEPSYESSVSTRSIASLSSTAAMSDQATLERAIAEANFTRYRVGQTAGHYESFFLRGNHPERPEAFWIRYTIFSPRNRPDDALGELWAVHFDGETNRHVAVKRETPLRNCQFSNTEMRVHVDETELAPGHAVGSAATHDHSIGWNLKFSTTEPPLFLLPLDKYEAKMPRAKSLVAAPMATFDGSIFVDGRGIDVKGWRGSQNHNWGERHTDHYAWGQVAGFDTHPHSFLEVATARLKIGPLWTPFMTILVLRHEGREIRLQTIPQALRARAGFTYFDWHFRSQDASTCIEGRIHAPAEAFVCLNYPNPPGGSKHCLNSKIAACELEVTDRKSGKKETLRTAHRAAFEILTDDRDHGLEVRC